MSTIPKTLPYDSHQWQQAVKSHGLTGQTVHTAELASASKMTYLQFLLLRVIWKEHKTKPLNCLPEEVKSLIPKAKQLLADLPSWKPYLEGFRGPGIPEGTFSIARHYQMEAIANRGATRPDSFDTPVAKHTRSHTRGLDKMLRDTHLETPSKKPAVRPQTPIRDISDEFSVFLDATPSPPSAPITPAAQVPEDLQRDMLVPTKDEQIVNTALVVFLNALNISRGCNWTMHRKAFIAEFEEAEFEARTDGYLDDGNENPYALIEVKPIARGKKASLIQVQEGAQMVSWIKNDPDAKPDKPCVFR